MIYESLVALEKIRDESAGPELAFLLHDLNEKVQLTAIEATGLLLNRGALDSLRDVLDRSQQHESEARRAHCDGSDARSEIARRLRGVPGSQGRRAARGRGGGAWAGSRIPTTLPALEKAFYQRNTRPNPGFRTAFALVDLGKHGIGEFDPLRYLINNLNSAAYRGVALPYLTELARDPAVRQALYPALKESTATKDEKTGLAQMLAASGGEDAVAPLQALSQDTDSDVAQAGLLALKNLHARLP